MFTSRLRTAYAPNMLLAELRTAECFIVSSLRLWALPHCAPDPVYPYWRRGLIQAKIDSAGAMGFDALCRIMAATVLRRLDFRPVHCVHLGKDEARLLLALGLLQREQIAEAEAVLRALCPPTAARLAIAPARVFVIALGRQRLWIPCRNRDPVAFGPPASTISGAGGSTLIH